MQFDPKELNEKDVYKLLIGFAEPRPIAWVSNISTDGIVNLAHFSFYNVAYRNSPMPCISIGPGVGVREGTEKDTLVNIRNQMEFVINVVSSYLGNEMQKTSGNFPSDVDEFSAKRVKKRPSKWNVS